MSVESSIAQRLKLVADEFDDECVPICYSTQAILVRFSSSMQHSSIEDQHIATENPLVKMIADRLKLIGDEMENSDNNRRLQADPRHHQMNELVRIPLRLILSCLRQGRPIDATPMTLFKNMPNEPRIAQKLKLVAEEFDDDCVPNRLSFRILLTQLVDPIYERFRDHHRVYYYHGILLTFMLGYGLYELLSISNRN